MSIMDDLPEELLELIFESMDIVTLVRSMQVCQRFKDIIRQTPSLQVSYQLALQNLVPLYLPEPQEALNLLERHRHAWQTCNWSRSFTLKMRDGGLWELYGGVLAQQESDGAFHFLRLPSDLRSIEELRWSVAPNGHIAVRDFGIEPSQDLLALVESHIEGTDSFSYRVHLLSMSTGAVHPLVKDSTAILSVARHAPSWAPSLGIQASGDYFLLHLRAWPRSQTEQLVIWNWKVGRVELNIFGRWIYSASLLSNERVLLGVSGDDLQPKLVVLDFLLESPDLHSIETVAHANTFAFEPIQSWPLGSHWSENGIVDMDIRAEPGPATFSPPGLKIPFGLDTRERLIAVTQHVRSGVLHYFIPSRAITTLIGATKTSQWGRLFAWDEWGPQRTRCFLSPQPVSNVWVCTTYGMRGVLPKIDHSSWWLFEFNQGVVHQSLRERQVKVKETRVSKPFRKDVVTRGQFQISTFRGDEHARCEVMLSEDNLVFVDPLAREYRIMVF